MMRRWAQLWRHEGGAVAPTVGLSLFALVAVGGLAFDYARMAGMDTELQNAADQAALAAASQLDGEAGACARAASAARAMITNRTLMANDGAASGTAITVADEATCDAAGNVRFYQDKAKTQPATADENAKFVEVQVDARRAEFAFTPVVGAISSGDITAIAFAGLGEAICRVPPLMMCNPDEDGDPDFTIANYVGKGIRLVANDGGGNYGPGNFGFLASGAGNGVAILRQILGRNGEPGNCVSGAEVETEPGNMMTLRDALNTRFDMMQNGLNQACGGNGALCPPSANSRKDLVMGPGNNCGFQTSTGGTNGWREPANVYPNLPLTTTPRPLTAAEINSVAPMGYPRDMCHAFSVMGSCLPVMNGNPNRIGDGNWDRNAYFRTNTASYPGGVPDLAATYGTTTPTRYQVYKHEMANAATLLAQDSRTLTNQTAISRAVCTPPGITPSETQIDRRVLSVAVINCGAEGVSGRTPNVAVTKHIDIFLTEPAVARQRTENGDVYVEVVGVTQITSDGGAVQQVRKSVPYLIE